MLDVEVMAKDSEMLISFTKNNAITCLNLNEESLKFIFKSSLRCVSKERNKRKRCVGAVNHSLIFY